MKAGSVLVRTGLVITLLLLLAPGVRADLVFEPGAADTFESLQYLALAVTSAGQPLATSSIPSATPLTISYQVGYGDRMFTHPDHTPETRAQSFQYMLEDNTTYLELWSGEPFTPGATLVESKQTGPETSGTVTFAPLEPGDYFLVYFSSLEIRDRTAYCVRYEVPTEECADPIYVTEYPVAESRVYFSTPIESLIEVSEVQPTFFGGFRLTVEESVSGVSNVLFLPGIKGSRLYRPTDSCNPDLALSCLGVKLWEPSGDLLLRDLFLNSHGDSSRSDIYAKEEDIVSEVLGANFYASFVNQMNALKEDGTFTDWKPIAYDWRLSLDSIVNNGVKRGDKIYYQEQTDTPYIEQSLKELAATSPTGKVSIVAHSNGGLVTKKLMQRLEANGEADLVDQIIFVGVPQSGAPQAMAGLLYGYGEALPRDWCAESFFAGWLCALFGSRDVARELAEHSPMAYHLLPSQSYFDQVHDTEHPVAKFNAVSTYLEERNRYGVTIDTAQELYDFLEAKDGGRTKPDVNDTASANVLSASFLNYGRETHVTIDSWTPPEGVTVHQIAGWGMNTIAGVEFYEQRKLLGGYKEMYRPIFVEDGDRVVPIPSALLMSSAEVESYWVNLPNASFGDAPSIDHSTLFELDEIRILIRDLLLQKSSSLPEFVSRSQPEPNDGNRLIFFLHSPLTLEIYDEDGNHTGETGASDFDQEIPDVEYGEFGDVKYIIAPAGEYEVVLRGKDVGTFSLDIQKMSGNEMTSSITLADVPTTKSTIATITVTDDLSKTGTLKVDEDGDGTIDLEVTPVENETVIFEAETAPVTVEDNSRSSSRTQRKQVVLTSSSEDTTIPAVFAHETRQPVFEEARVALLPAKQEVDATMPTEEKFEIPEEVPTARTQTASVYDSLGAGVMNWMGSILYNFWSSLMKMFTSFLTN